MKVGEKVKAAVTKADYYNSGKNYIDGGNCPLATMAKRVLGKKYVAVAGTIIIVPETLETKREEYKCYPGFYLSDYNKLEMNGTEMTLEIERIS